MSERLDESSINQKENARDFGNMSIFDQVALVDSIEDFVNGKIKSLNNIDSPDIHAATIQAFNILLSKRKIETALKVKNTFHLLDDLTQEIILRQIRESLGISSIGHTEKFSRTFGMDFVVGQLSKLDVNSNINFVEKIINSFNLPKDSLEQTLQQAMIESISCGDFYTFSKLKDAFGEKTETNSIEFQDAAKNGVYEQITSENFDNAKKIIEMFNLSESLVNEIVEKAIEHATKYPSSEKRVQKIKKVFNIKTS